MFKTTFNWDDFLSHYWQKKPIVLKNAFQSFNDPITPDELAGLAMEHDLDSRIVTHFNDTWDAKYGPFTHYDDLGESHWSLLVQAVDHWHSEAAKLVEPFRVLPHWQFEDLMISYATPQGSVGPHIDNYDVFIIQGMGKRNWKVGDRNPNYTQFSAHKALLHVEEYEPIIDVILETGDILYIPIGYPHHGVSLTESLSYSVGFRTPTSQELLSGFADYVMDELPTGDFYQDPELKLSKKPYEIDEREQAKLKQKVIDLINNDAFFNDFLGKKISEAMHSLDILECEPPFDFNEFKDDWLNDKVFLAVPSIRLIKIGSHGYINGQKIELSEPIIERLCQHRYLSKSLLDSITLSDDELKHGLLPLINQGFLFLDDAE